MKREARDSRCLFAHPITAIAGHPTAAIAPAESSGRALDVARRIECQPRKQRAKTSEFVGLAGRLIGVGKAFAPPLPPNRTGGFPAYGSPVDGFLTGTVSLSARPRPG